MKILVTGASGFVGTHLCGQLIKKGHTVRAACRKIPEDRQLEYINCGDLSKDYDWSKALNGIEVVVHLAAKAHQTESDDLASTDVYDQLNWLATKNLASQSEFAGVKRFVFLSTAKVNGDWTINGQSFSSYDQPSPVGAYAISKHRAEIELHKIASHGLMDIVIIRPPVVYGPGMGGNFLKLLSMVNKWKILPFGEISNLRSILYVGNLTDFIIKCLINTNARNQIFMVADEAPLNFSNLIFELSLRLKKNIYLIPIPIFLWKLGLVSLNKEVEFNRLFKSFVLSTKNSSNILNWKPPYSTKEGLDITVMDYLINNEAKY